MGSNSKYLNLFGEEVEQPSGTGRVYATYLQDWIKRSGYRKSKDMERECRTCRWRRSFSYANTYHKCKLFKTSNSSATDIRLNHVCNFWEGWG